MPNHCETDFTITGPRTDVEEVLALHFNTSGELNCDSVIPYPEKYKEMDRLAKEWALTHCDETGWRLKPEYEGQDIRRPTDGFNAGGYEWCCESWGTKWGTYDGHGISLTPMKFDKLKAELTFQSAWSPPTPVFHTLAEKYPQLIFRAESFEMGMGYRLVQKWKGGIQITAREYAYRGHRGG